MIATASNAKLLVESFWAKRVPILVSQFGKKWGEPRGLMWVFTKMGGARCRRKGSRDLSTSGSGEQRAAEKMMFMGGGGGRFRIAAVEISWEGLQ